MKHLSPETLGALLDGALSDAQRADAERHLEGCAECQAALAALLAQDTLTHQALEHDPGEAYFESFAGRVSERIRAEDRAAAQPRRRAPQWWETLWTPRGLAFAGSAAALLVVGVLALQQSRSQQNALTNRQLLERTAQQESAPTAAPQASPQAASGGEAAPDAAAPSAGTESKQRAPQASTSALAPTPGQAPAPELARDAGDTREAREDAGGAVRKEAAAKATAQQSVIPNGAGEERIARSRESQDGAAKDVLGLQDAAPAPPAANEKLSDAAGPVGAVRPGLLGSLKGKRAVPLKPEALATGEALSRRSLAAPASPSSAATSLNEAVAGFAWPAASRALVARAESLSVIAGGGEAAAAHDAAALGWERVRDALVTASPSRLEAQARVAEARVAAWRLAPSPLRSTAARGALSSVLGMLPQGPRRQHFESLLLRVREGADHP